MKNDSVVWTDEQSAAITLRNRTLLVSAAAGSGKTAVLTERIIKRITDIDSPADISRMLIVTYTKAAAAELRSRISKAISSAIAENPSNKHLSRQLLLLGSAKISTIHSFCLDIIRKNASVLSLPDGMSVASEPEVVLLCSETLNETIDNAYSDIFEPGYEIEDFANFIDLFSSKGNDKETVKLFTDIYKRVLNYPEGVGLLHIWAEKLLDSAEKPFFVSEQGKIVFNDINQYISYVLLKYQALFEETRENDDVAFSSYVGLMSDEISFLQSISGALSSCRLDLLKSFNSGFDFARLPSLPRGYKSIYTEKIKEVREELKKLKGKKLDIICKYNEASMAEYSRLSAGVLEKLYKLLSAFDIAFRREKAKNRKLDFTDIERYAYSLLVNNDGTPSDIAVNISKDYDEIYIDEYQDTNSVQDMIFSSIATPNNRFMVGDIKQSIYGFRGAAPENFAGYRDAFTPYEINSKSADFSPCTIFLADNFRCDDSVVDFCNRIFSRLFTNNTGRIKYYPSDNLVCSKKGGKDDTIPVNVVLAYKDSDDSELITEPKYIANEISELIKNGVKKDGSKIKPSDIAILIRGWASSIPLEEALSAAGIPTHNNAQTEFFENPEILLMMSLLNTIDNPLRDIYLTGALKSPLFGFTLDELITIRAEFPNTSLYEAIIAYTEANGFEKGSCFLNRLEYFRELTTGVRIDRLIWKLYRECDMFALCAKTRKAGTSINEARQNLMLLYKYAREFEASSFKGLSAFIKYIDDIIANQTKLPSPSGGSKSANAVKIMTIHQSKGLEYPVVFVAATHKNRSNKDIAPSILFDREAGFSVNLTDEHKISKIKTLNRKALEIRITENNAEEEMRILYVALTRARERLYVTGSYKSPEKEIEKAKALSENLCPFVIMGSSNYMRMILISLYNSGEGNYNIIVPESTTISEGADQLETQTVFDNPDAFFEKIRSNMQFKYKHTSAGLVPSKISVSELSSDIYTNDTEADISDAEKKLSEISPLFMRETKAVPSGADKGTATHIFMQFCNFEKAEVQGARLELDRLEEQRFISRDVAMLVDTEKANGFFKSNLYQDIIKKAEKVYREYRFNVRLPASDFTTNPKLKTELENQTLFIQGVIDCFVKNQDGTYTLIDYKTDYIPPEMKENKAEACKMLTERHSAQLSYYRRAIEIITLCKVSKVYIYSFGLGEEIDITDFT